MVELNQICRDVLTLTCLSGTRAGAELGEKFCKFLEILLITFSERIVFEYVPSFF